MFRSLGLAVPLLALLGGCGTKSAPPGELLLYCGAGLKPPVAEIIEAFEAKTGARVAADYAGGDHLLAKLRASGRGDLFLPGDDLYLDQAAAHGFVAARRTLCYFVPTILVRKGNPKGIRAPADVCAPGIKLGLGDPSACAIGKQSRLLFEKNGVPWETARAGCVFQSLTVNELGMQIQAGALDAVIVWDAVAQYYERHGDEVPIPIERNVVSEVALAVLSSSRQRDLAEAFLAFAASEAGRALFVKHRYRVERPR
jgi:molybdate transport system substrate-binding protein